VKVRKCESLSAVEGRTTTMLDSSSDNQFTMHSTMGSERVIATHARTRLPSALQCECSEQAAQQPRGWGVGGYGAGGRVCLARV
jgi:hypothetical protein